MNIHLMLSKIKNQQPFFIDESRKHALEKLYQFISQPSIHKIALLLGFNGDGKSYLMKHLLEYMNIHLQYKCFGFDIWSITNNNQFLEVSAIESGLYVYNLNNSGSTLESGGLHKLFDLPVIQNTTYVLVIDFLNEFYLRTMNAQSYIIKQLGAILRRPDFRVIGLSSYQHFLSLFSLDFIFAKRYEMYASPHQLGPYLDPNWICSIHSLNLEQSREYLKQYRLSEFKHSPQLVDEQVTEEFWVQKTCRGRMCFLNGYGIHNASYIESPFFHRLPTLDHIKLFHSDLPVFPWVQVTYRSKWIVCAQDYVRIYTIVQCLLHVHYRFHFLRHVIFDKHLFYLILYYLIDPFFSG